MASRFEVSTSVIARLLLALNECRSALADKHLQTIWPPCWASLNEKVERPRVDVANSRGHRAL